MNSDNVIAGRSGGGDNRASVAGIFSTKKLILLLVLPLAVLFIFCSWYTLYMYAKNKIVDKKYHRVMELSGSITYFDEVLTMSAAMAAATGNLEWEQRYRLFEPQLDSYIKEVVGIAPQDFMTQAVQRTDTANMRLAAMENKAFEMVGKGNLKAAFELLNSQDYQQQKQTYSNGIRQFTAAMQKHMEGESNKYHIVVLTAVTLWTVCTSFLLFSFVFVLQKHRLAEHKRASFEDITESKQIEQKQKKLVEELESVNHELKDFAYIISHDLKAPLRGITTLASWISNDYADKFDEQGKEQLCLLMERVNRMYNMIDGVLQYSRVGRIREEKVPVDLNALVEKVIDTIDRGDNIEVAVDNELPVVKFEPTRIRQIFQNLLGNAVRYMGKPEGQIKIGCVADKDFWKFSVADNGPGIKKENFERIFKIFQTLVPQDKSESAGVGLTVVKKIVELYGGKIWLESEPGEGTTFFFTLPKKEIGVEADERLETHIVS